MMLSSELTQDVIKFTAGYELTYSTMTTRECTNTDTWTLVHLN